MYKSSTDKQVMGVCGGLGDFFNIDPTIIRVIFLVIFFAYGTGFLLYLILGLALPYDYQVDADKRQQDSDNPFKYFSQRTSGTGNQANRKDVTPPEDDEGKWSDF